VIRVKEGVRFDDLVPQMTLAAQIVDGTYAMFGTLECWITSANDGKHMETSWHYKGRALDFRTHNFVGDKKKLLEKVKEHLGKNYDVVLEAPDSPNEHLHVEYDPKEVS
jgi:hypothetical protein